MNEVRWALCTNCKTKTRSRINKKILINYFLSYCTKCRQ
ncbi:cysteine-rich KTR domain-containing protein [Enterococcus faecalis]|nr:hypothetical protein [Enterococcus faecalis]